MQKLLNKIILLALKFYKIIYINCHYKNIDNNYLVITLDKMNKKISKIENNKNNIMIPKVQ